MAKRTDEWIAEAELATALNVPRETLRALRLTLPAAEVRQQGNEWLWKKTAAHTATQRMGLPAPGLGEAPPDEIEALTVHSRPVGSGWHFANPHIIKARRDNGAVVDVRVVDSRKYLPVGRDGEPMILQAKKARGNNFWLLVGREPRFPGMW